MRSHINPVSGLLIVAGSKAADSEKRGQGRNPKPLVALIIRRRKYHDPFVKHQIGNDKSPTVYQLRELRPVITAEPPKQVERRSERMVGNPEVGGRQRPVPRE